MTHLIPRRDFLQLLAAVLAAPATPTPTPVKTLSTPTPVPKATPQASPTSTTQQLQPWLQALRPLTLWSGPDDQAEPLGTAALWDYFLVSRPPLGGRLYVLVARSGNYAWVDALSVGPSGPPPPGWPPADLPPPPEDLSLGWVTAPVDSGLWTDAQAGLLLGSVPAWTSLKQMAP